MFTERTCYETEMQRLIARININDPIFLLRVLRSLHCVKCMKIIHQGQRIAAADHSLEFVRKHRGSAIEPRCTSRRAATSPRFIYRVGGLDQCSLRRNAKNDVVVIAADGLWAELSARNNMRARRLETARGQTRW